MKGYLLLLLAVTLITFVDVTNLAKPRAGHMRNLAVTFEDKDHIKQVWTFRMDGKDEKTIFNLERKK